MENYLVRIAIKKGVQGLVKGIVAFLISTKAMVLETKMGITINPVAAQAGMASVALAGIEVAHDWAKAKFPNVGWL